MMKQTTRCLERKDSANGREVRAFALQIKSTSDDGIV